MSPDYRSRHTHEGQIFGVCQTSKIPTMRACVLITPPQGKRGWLPLMVL